MASHRARKHETCAHEDCGSRRFHVGEDGFTYCDQGHQQSERGTVVAEDTGELLLLGKTSRKKDSDAESATSRASSLSGSHAFEHYLLCVQLVLRKQVHWLVDIQQLPVELEALVKHLWALRLQKVESRITYESETDTEAPSSQVFSSQSESEATTASRSTRRGRRRRNKEKTREGSPRLIETIALCYVAGLFLRLPITVADMHHWMNEGQLLYYRAAREVPLGMRERLPPRYQAQLEPQDLLSPSALHAEVLELLKTFADEVGMSPPVPSVPLIMFRWLQHLMLPVEMYAATHRLARLLEIEFDFDLSIKDTSKTSLRYPEARLMAIILAAAKLLFPLDEIERSAASGTDLSALRMDWTAWSKQQAALKQKEATTLNFEECFDFDEAACYSASGDRLDSYLDWYEGNVSTEEIRERGRAGRDADVRRAMFAMFQTHAARADQTPRSAAGQVSLEESVRVLQSKLTTRSLFDMSSEENESSLIGSFYRGFRDADELSGPSKTLYERAAELAGLSLDEMVQVVFALERKMQGLEERLRKEDRV